MRQHSIITANQAHTIAIFVNTDKKSAEMSLLVNKAFAEISYSVRKIAKSGKYDFTYSLNFGELEDNESKISVTEDIVDCLIKGGYDVIQEYFNEPNTNIISSVIFTISWNLLHKYTRSFSDIEHKIVASLVESMTDIDSERPLMASVIYNRLKDGMKLQIDETIYYCFEKYGTPLNRDLVVSDYIATGGAYDLPYNTYRYYGLPAEPICEPSETSLESAIDPAETPYRFYVLSTKGDGSHVFSSTYEEHEKNVDAYFKWKNSRPVSGGE